MREHDVCAECHVWRAESAIWGGGRGGAAWVVEDVGYGIGCCIDDYGMVVVIGRRQGHYFTKMGYHEGIGKARNTYAEGIWAFWFLNHFLAADLEDL